MTKELLVSLVALVVAIGGYLYPVQQFGSGTRFTNGISADSTSPAAGEVRGADLTLTDDAVVGDDLTVSGGTFTVTTTNTATSSAYVGCYQTTATSTASPIKFVINTASTSGATGQYFDVVAGFGTCP